VSGVNNNDRVFDWIDRLMTNFANRSSSGTVGNARTADRRRISRFIISNPVADWEPTPKRT